MKYKMLTHAIVIGCMLSGAAIMAYVGSQERLLENPESIKTTQKCTKQIKSCKFNS